MALTPDEKALASAMECIISVKAKRITAAQAGRRDSASVGIPWRRFLEMVDAIEAARPGLIARAREIQERGD